ncbi:MAG: leucine-rich repeat protein, partial [Ruminococcus sp.]|nr:leucine-rich repeat protein [Ruminococcus sp.]
EEYTIERFDPQLFWNCQKLEKVILPNKLNEKEYYNSRLDRRISGGKLSADMFNGCKSLKEVTLPDNLVEIATCVFYGCESLESITVPDGVLCADHDAFAGTKLKYLTLPSSLEYVSTDEMSKDTIIICDADSKIYEFLQKENAKYPEYAHTLVSTKDTDVFGDVNRDNCFNIIDVSFSQKVLVKKVDIQFANADMLDFNGDGKINITDVTAMQRALAKM